MIWRIGIPIGLLVFTAAIPAATRKSDRAVRFPTTCAAIAPTDIALRPAIWLGDCVLGKADGLGILRMGGRPLHAFFVGQMKAGRPASGLLFDVDKSYWTARGFDAKGHVLIADGNYLKEQDQAWADAVRAARSVSDRIAKAGNAGSAAYYRRFASEIENGRPE